MNELSKNVRDLSAEPYDTRTLLKNAVEQAIERRYEDFFMVDVDSHHYETESFAEIVSYIRNPVIREEAKFQGMSRGGITSENGSYQELTGRITRYPKRKTEKVPPTPHRDIPPRSEAGWESAWRRPERQRQTPSSKGAVETAGPRAERLPNQKSQTPYRDKPRTGSDSSLTVLFFFEKPLQVETADGRSSGIKASAHRNFLPYLLHQLGGNVESFGLAVDQYGNLELGMQVLAVGAMTVGPAAGTFAFDKGAGQHFTERTEPTDEFAAQFQVRVGRRFHMTLILVSEKGKSQAPRRFAKMPPNRTWSRNPVNKRTGE